MSYVGMYLNLKPHMSSWRVYNVNGPYTTAYAIGSLAPATYGGLSYRIREEKGNNVYVILIESFGLCAIWAPRDNDSTITSTPAYSNGDLSSGTTPLGEMNSKGFAQYLGVKFTATGQTLTLFTSSSITVKLRNSLSATSNGTIIANFADGQFTSGSYRTQLLTLTQNLDNAGYGVSAKLAKIKNINFSVALTSNTTDKITITLTASTPITSYSAANQSIIIEISKQNLPTAYATNTLPSLSSSIYNTRSKLPGLVFIALLVAIIAVTGVVTVLLIKTFGFGTAALALLALLIRSCRISGLKSVSDSSFFYSIN